MRLLCSGNQAQLAKGIRTSACRESAASTRSSLIVYEFPTGLSQLPNSGSKPQADALVDGVEVVNLRVAIRTALDSTTMYLASRFFSGETYSFAFLAKG